MVKTKIWFLVLTVIALLIVGCSGGESKSKKTLEYVDFSDTDYQLFKLGEIQYHMPVGYTERDLLSDTDDETEDQGIKLMSYENGARTCTYFVDYNTNPKALDRFKDVKDKEFQEEYLKEWEESDNAFELRSSKNIVIDEHDAWEIECISSDYKNETRYHKYVFFLSDTALYSIRLSDKTGTTGTYADDFEGVINSIHFK